MTGTARVEPGKLRTVVAVAVIRVVIPLWLAAGAVLKLADGSPSHLPAALIKWCGAIGLNLRYVLELSIAVELIVAGVMVLLPTLARPVGTALLITFVPVLIGDLALGASSCGCFGAVEVPPWVTLVTDLFFLFTLLVLARGVPSLAWSPTLPSGRVLAAGIWSLASMAAAFAPFLVGINGVNGANGANGANGGNGVTGAPPAAESAALGPAEGFYLPDYGSWIGQRFRDLDLASWIRGLPEDLDAGTQYILFYRKDCEHCHALMEVFFADGEQLPTTAVAVPERTGYPTVGVQPLVCAGCRLAELPAGVDWFLQTPVLVRIADGVVECAAEVTADAPVCIVGF
ncbi:MAG TPA: hypothetical protein VLB51_13280 [Methylomirabilota bacterium]|nr:hypothetical protein [Methylomirabilota bacterium]